jgi:hypothetical protein
MEDFLFMEVMMERRDTETYINAASKIKNINGKKFIVRVSSL